jgi:hypothetical protein
LPGHSFLCPPLETTELDIVKFVVIYFPEVPATPADQQDLAILFVMLLTDVFGSQVITFRDCVKQIAYNFER